MRLSAGSHGLASQVRALALASLLIVWEVQGHIAPKTAEANAPPNKDEGSSSVARGLAPAAAGTQAALPIPGPTSSPVVTPDDAKESNVEQFPLLPGQMPGPPPTPPPMGASCASPSTVSACQKMLGFRDPACCAPAGQGGCAQGYKYTRGAVCLEGKGPLGGESFVTCCSVAPTQSPNLPAAEEQPLVTTTVTVALQAGATVVPVANQAGFQVGGKIVIDSGVLREVGVMASFGSIILKQPLQYAHAAGVNISMFKGNAGRNRVIGAGVAAGVAAATGLAVGIAAAVQHNQPPSAFMTQNVNAGETQIPESKTQAFEVGDYVELGPDLVKKVVAKGEGSLVIDSPMPRPMMRGTPILDKKEPPGLVPTIDGPRSREQADMFQKQAAPFEIGGSSSMQINVGDSSGSLQNFTKQMNGNIVGTLLMILLALFLCLTVALVIYCVCMRRSKRTGVYGGYPRPGGLQVPPGYGYDDDYEEDDYEVDMYSGGPLMGGPPMYYH